MDQFGCLSLKTETLFIFKPMKMCVLKKYKACDYLSIGWLWLSGDKLLSLISDWNGHGSLFKVLLLNVFWCICFIRNYYIFSMHLVIYVQVMKWYYEVMSRKYILRGKTILTLKFTTFSLTNSLDVPNESKQ